MGLLGTGNTARFALGIAARTLVLLSCFLFLLGLVAGALVFLGHLALEEAPDTIHQNLLVAANLEAVLLAELIQNSGGAVVELVASLDRGGILDLVGLENLLGLGFGGGIRDRVLHDVLEDTGNALIDEIHNGLLELVVEFVGVNEGVNDLFEAGHFWKL